MVNKRDKKVYILNRLGVASLVSDNIHDIITKGYITAEDYKERKNMNLFPVRVDGNEEIIDSNEIFFTLKDVKETCKKLIAKERKITFGVYKVQRDYYKELLAQLEKLKL